MFNAAEIEDKWRKKWADSEIFRFDENDSKTQVFAIDTPPPFTNGDLHMGQVFWICYIDAIARYKRMSGFNVLYPQGWDAHGFPTEIAVEKKFGKNMESGEFYRKCVELSNSNIKKMRERMMTLGATFDDRYEYNTTSEEFIRKVQLSLIWMQKRGMLYKASHPVMWCVKDESGIGNPETEEKEVEADLNYVKFQVAGVKKHITIATTRPELMHACVAVAINPKDERLEALKGKSLKVPIYGTEVPIITDDYVDQGFGTGMEMVCTYGDKADMAMSIKHKLAPIKAIDEKGRLLNAGDLTGTKIDSAREKVLDKLREEGALEKQERIKHVVKVHDRCGTRIEYIDANQWFIKTTEYADMVKATSDEISWHPEFTKQRLHDWANFIEWDWNITRTKVFGTPMPFWSCGKCNFILAPDEKELPINTSQKRPDTIECPECGGEIAGTRETVDNWVDSSITPLIIAGWPDNRELLARAYPNSVRIQGTDIIRTWAFYTVLRGRLIGGSKPWNDIIVHGMILGIDGKEMHKRFGNGITLDDLLPKYSVDTVRLWVAMSGGTGKDKAFSYAEMDYAKSFINKLYNSSRFVDTALKSGKLPEVQPSSDLGIFDIWILNRLNSLVKEVRDSYDEFNLYNAMNRAIGFFWHEFADYYIENVKYRIYSEEKGMQASKNAAIFTLDYVMRSCLKIFAPVIPFVCEEINESMKSRESIFGGNFPVYVERARGSDYAINGIIQRSSIEADYESLGGLLNQIIGDVRKAKSGAKKALNYEISSININVPEEYYKVSLYSKDELKSICKARNVEISKGSYSVKVDL